VQIAALVINADRKKLKERLTAELRNTRGTDGGAAGPRAAVAYRVEIDRVTAALVRWAPMAALNARVTAAFPDMMLSTFLAIAIGCAIGGVLAGLWMFGPVPFALSGAVAGGCVPLLVIAGGRARRLRTLGGQLPDALDFLARVLKSGHSFSTGLQMLGAELPKPLCLEFRKAYDQHSLGQSVEDVLKDMARRIQSTDFAFFVTAVLIQRQTGGDLAEVLRNISAMIRNRVRLQQHVKAKTAEGRFTGYVLVAFPLGMFVLLSLMNPRYAHTLTATATGHKLLALSFGLQMLGLWTIRKITTIKV
jgi:tight adherence protein B